MSATPHVTVLARLHPDKVDDAVQLLDERGLGRLALHAEEVASILTEAKAIKTITNRTEEGKASELISRGVVVLKELDALRRSVTDPLNDQVKAVNAVFKVITDPCDAQTGKRGPLEILIVTFRQAEKARLAREAAEAQRKQEEAAKREADAIAKAEAAKNPKAREKALAEAQAASEEQMRASADESFARGASTIKGIRTDSGSNTERTRWTYTIVKPELVPREYLCPDEKAIRAAVAAGVRSIPGVAIEEEAGLTRRTG